MKIVRVKARVILLFVVIGSLNSCEKQDGVSQETAIIYHGDASPRLRRRFPPIFKIPLPMSRCIYAYQDALAIFGGDRLMISKVKLESGAEIGKSADLPYIAYQAVPPTLLNSLFDSKFIIEWRRPGELLQGSTIVQPSLGCAVTTQPPPISEVQEPGYTNIIMGADTLLINTRLYWPGYEHTGELIQYLYIP